MGRTVADEKVSLEGLRERRAEGLDSATQVSLVSSQALLKRKCGGIHKVDGDRRQVLSLKDRPIHVPEKSARRLRPKARTDA